LDRYSAIAVSEHCGGAACAFDAAPATDWKTRWVAREKPVSMTNSKALLA
jgi:hypothetical protein